MFFSGLLTKTFSFMLNFHLPGAGLIVLGRPREGGVYLALALILGMIAVYPMASDFDRFFAIFAFDILVFESNHLILKRVDN